ncbi:DUF5958 family protein [Streptomyces sp. NPDC054837]
MIEEVGMPSVLGLMERREVRARQDLESRTEVLEQAQATAADGRAGVVRSGVKPTANPAVMICMDPPRYGFAGLPAAEHVTAFRVLVSVFAVADTRRRETYCQGACGHAWHHLPAATEQP